MTKETKAAIIADFATKAGDCGSSQVQIALLSAKIKDLTEHLKIHRKDYSTRRGLIAMVNRRRKLLRYLNGKNHTQYVGLVGKLGLRR